MIPEMFPGVTVTDNITKSMVDDYKEKLITLRGQWKPNSGPAMDLDPESLEGQEKLEKDKVIQSQLSDIGAKIGILEAIGKGIGFNQFLKKFTGVGTAVEKETKYRQMWSSVEKEVDKRIIEIANLLNELATLYGKGRIFARRDPAELRGPLNNLLNYLFGNLKWGMITASE